MFREQPSKYTQKNGGSERMKRLFRLIRAINRDEPFLLYIPALLVFLFGLVPLRCLGILTEQGSIKGVFLIHFGFILWILLKLLRLSLKSWRKMQ